MARRHVLYPVDKETALKVGGRTRQTGGFAVNTAPNVENGFNFLFQQIMCDSVKEMFPPQF